MGKHNFPDHFIFLNNLRQLTLRQEAKEIRCERLKVKHFPMLQSLHIIFHRNWKNRALKHELFPNYHKDLNIEKTREEWIEEKTFTAPNVFKVNIK